MNKNSFFSNVNNQYGQALLIVVLVMVVALTVGLSIASKSITNFRNSTEQASSQKALSAAEAGIEQAIKSTSNDPINGSYSSQETSYSTLKTTVGGPGMTEFLLNVGNSILQGSGIDLWLTTYSKIQSELYQLPYYPNGENFTVYWGDSSGDCSNAALEVAVIVGTKASSVISRYAFDPCLDRRGATINDPGNHFAACSLDGKEGCTSAQATIAGRKFYYQATIPVNDGGVAGGGGLVARVVPLYMNAIMAVKSINTHFPIQGSDITSVGKSGNTERKVNVFQGYPQLPAEYFLYNLFVP